MSASTGCRWGRCLTLTEEAADELDGLQGATASLEKSFQRGRSLHLHKSHPQASVTRHRSCETREDIPGGTDPTELEDKVPTTHEVRKVHNSPVFVDGRGDQKRDFKAGKES